MKKIKICIFVFVICTFMIGCMANDSETSGSIVSGKSEITDIYGNKVVLPENPRVVSCYGSFAECWILSGGELVGVTDDAVNERKLNISDEVCIVGTVKDINLEIIVSLAPDYVILSADIAAQAPLEESLRSMNIPYGYFRVDNFDHYSKMMQQFCLSNGRADLYNKYVTQVQDEICEIIDVVPEEDKPTYLLMRVYSTGIKVKSDNIADMIIKDLGGKSIIDDFPSLLSDLSVEEVIKSDPDYIFVLTMGEEKSGEEYFRKNIADDPLWSSLSAIKNNNYHILPKDLFHYKPNHRWGKSYLHIAEIFYPEIYKYEKK